MSPYHAISQEKLLYVLILIIRAIIVSISLPLGRFIPFRDSACSICSQTQFAIATNHVLLTFPLLILVLNLPTDVISIVKLVPRMAEKPEA